MPAESKEDVFERWAAEVRRRVGDHRFASPLDKSGESLLDRLLSATYWKHFHSPYAFIEPPLQDFPSLPLENRWAAVRIRDENDVAWFRVVQIGDESVESLPATQSAHSLLTSGDSYCVLGLPGSGKSTLLRGIAQYLIQEPRLTSTVPMYVPLRSYVRWKERKTDGIHAFFWSGELRLPQKHAGVFEQFMEDIEGDRGEQRHLFRVLLDGWDEIPASAQGELLPELERMQRTLPVILTSRPAGFVSCLPPWPKFAITPLTFKAMRTLMHDWYRLVGKPELELATCRHLDKHMGLRELARNPFVLTLLCAVITRRHGRLPTARYDLYRDALLLISRYCEEHKHEHGFGFDSGVMCATERLAYELLNPEGAVAYEFLRGDVKRIAGDDGTLFETLKSARVLKPANAFEGTFGFQHPTMHEFLAAQDFCRRIAHQDVQINSLAHRPEVLNVLSFAFGSADTEAKAELWTWLRAQCTDPDRFGLIFLKAAHWLAEAGERDGGSAKLGLDVRESLWNLFDACPSPRRYADALVALDAEWVIDKALKVSKSNARHPKVMMTKLLKEMLDRQSRSPELARHWLKLRQILAPANPKWKGIGPRAIDCEDYKLTLTATEAHRPETELIAEYKPEADQIQRRAALRKIALFGSDDAERFLVARLDQADGLADWIDIVDALGVMGTIGARDVLVDRVESVKNDSRRLIPILDALLLFPINGKASLVLGLMQKPFPHGVRVLASEVLGTAKSAPELNRLMDYARLSEPVGRVRQSVIAALARAKCFHFVGVLWVERTQGKRRPGPEYRVCVKYLGAIAKQMTATDDGDEYFHKVEILLLDAISGNNEIASDMIHCAAELRGSSKIRDGLRRIAEDAHRSARERAAAILGLEKLKVTRSVEELIGWLNEAVHMRGQEERAEACATVLAYVAPERLLGRKDRYSTMALWMRSLETEALVYTDRVVSAGAPADAQRDPEGETAHGESNSAKKPKPKAHGPGRPPEYDAEEDRRLYEAWRLKGFRYKKDLALDMGLDPQYVINAIERHRAKLKGPKQK